MMAVRLQVGLIEFIVATVCTGFCLSCGSEQEEMIYEQEVLQLPSKLFVETSVIRNDCAGQVGNLMGGQLDVTLTQTGNDFSWVQGSGDGSDDTPLVLDGRVCALEGSSYELRLRGNSTLRVADGAVFCRTTLSVPSTSCAESEDDICNDDSAIILSWDACSQAFYGEFPMALSYDETLCGGSDDCTIEVTMSASVKKQGEETCPPPNIGSVTCWDGQSCTCTSD